jgi:hypothetical protein
MHGDEPVAVIDKQRFAAKIIIIGIEHDAIGGRVNRSTRGDGYIEPGVRRAWLAVQHTRDAVTTR